MFDNALKYNKKTVLKYKIFRKLQHSLFLKLLFIFVKVRKTI